MHWRLTGFCSSVQLEMQAYKQYFFLNSVHPHDLKLYSRVLGQRLVDSTHCIMVRKKSNKEMLYRPEKKMGRTTIPQQMPMHPWSANS